MSSNDEEKGRGREGYHHGNLREALVEAALRLIAQYGPAGFSFAQAARAAGVSSAAPYRHFRDQQALVAEVARRGFERFAQALEAAWDEGRPDPMAAFERMGAAYLGFARRDPASYAAMFEPGFPIEQDATLQAASDLAFGVLRRAAETICATLPRGVRAPPMMVALHVWAMAHGVASLFIGHSNKLRRKVPMSAEELLESNLLVYLQGLGFGTAGESMRGR
jgi:AcrR family transcriptional regulator